MELSDLTVEQRFAILEIQSGIINNDDSEALEAYRQLASLDLANESPDGDFVLTDLGERIYMDLVGEMRSTRPDLSSEKLASFHFRLHSNRVSFPVD